MIDRDGLIKLVVSFFLAVGMSEGTNARAVWKAGSSLVGHGQEKAFASSWLRDCGNRCREENNVVGSNLIVAEKV